MGQVLFESLLDGAQLLLNLFLLVMFAAAVRGFYLRKVKPRLPRMSGPVFAVLFVLVLAVPIGGLIAFLSSPQMVCRNIEGTIGMRSPTSAVPLPGNLTKTAEQRTERALSTCQHYFEDCAGKVGPPDPNVIAVCQSLGYQG